jgi:hypothetical protein
VTRWNPRHALDRLVGFVGFAIIGAALVPACAPATINRLVIAATRGELAADRHDVLARHLRFYARVWSATSP